MSDAMLPWQWVRVSGPSMVPTLRPGERALVRRGARPRPGDVVLAVYRTMPGHHVVKRVARPDGDGWWLASDNAAAGGDSGVHGRADVLGRVVLVRSPARVLPRRPGRAPLS